MTWGNSPFCLFQTTIFSAFHSIDCSQFLLLHAFLFSFPLFIFPSLLHFESRDALGNHNLDLGYLAERNESRSR